MEKRKKFAFNGGKHAQFASLCIVWWKTWNHIYCHLKLISLTSHSYIFLFLFFKQAFENTHAEFLHHLAELFQIFRTRVETRSQKFDCKFNCFPVGKIAEKQSVRVYF